jgi:ABC-type Mn2+/Zn2+ transport system permease subunit
MSTEKARWFGLGVPVLVVVGLGIAIGLHIGLARPWSDLVLPIGAYVAIQVGTYVCMFWARNRSRIRGEYGLAIALIGFYAWGTGLLVIHYGTEWSLLSHESDDLIAFSAFMILVVAITFALFSLFKGRLKSTR